MASTQRVRFLVISDTHGMTLNSDISAALRLPPPETDVLLHCGNLTAECSPEELRRAVKLLQSVPAELRLVIAGSHNTLLDRAFHLAHGGRLEEHEEALNILKQAEGVTYLEEGTHRFTLWNGATCSVYASPYTPSQYGPQYGLHAFQHQYNAGRYNAVDANGTPSYTTNIASEVSAIPGFPQVDIVMTHGPPKYILGRAGDGSLRDVITSGEQYAVPNPACTVSAIFTQRMERTGSSGRISTQKPISRSSA